MLISRRRALTSALFGVGGIGLRALVTGLPVSLLANPRKALADVTPPTAAGKPQFILFCTSGDGDPIGANAPGTYDDPGIYHSPDPSMTKTALTLGGTRTSAALPWAALPQTALDRTSFWHVMTNTPIHPSQPEVMKLMHTTKDDEMFASVLARELAPRLGTIQSQPICLGATTPTEGITYGGEAVPILPAPALRATLTNPKGPLTDLLPLRDATLRTIYDIYKSDASAAQRAYIDSLVTTEAQLRKLNESLLDELASVKDNSPASQITAALALFRMKVSPVITIHIPFGGDNHHDPGLGIENAQTVSGVETIALLMTKLAALGLQDDVTFLSLNVFGRTLNGSTVNGRQHNANHQVSMAIGAPWRGGVVGSVAPVAGDYGATAMDSRSGRGTASGDVSAIDSLASFGKTVLASIGVDNAEIDSLITTGKVISGALA